MLYEARNVVLVFSAYMLIVCAPAPQYSQQFQPERNPVMIHEVVGTFIEPEEREYYGLFRGIEGFQEAVFFSRTDGGFDILIMSERHTYYAIYDASQADEILYDYIESFDEKDSAHRNFKKKWHVVGYDTLGLPFSKNDVDRVLDKHRVTMEIIYGGCFGSCFGAMYGLLDVEKDVNQATHIPSCKGTEDVPFLCIGGCLAGMAIAYSFEKSSIQRNPASYINKQRGPWIIE